MMQFGRNEAWSDETNHWSPNRWDIIGVCWFHRARQHSPQISMAFHLPLLLLLLQLSLSLSYLLLQYDDYDQHNDLLVRYILTQLSLEEIGPHPDGTTKKNEDQISITICARPKFGWTSSTMIQTFLGNFLNWPRFNDHSRLNHDILSNIKH